MILNTALKLYVKSRYSSIDIYRSIYEVVKTVDGSKSFTTSNTVPGGIDTLINNLHKKTSNRTPLVRTPLPNNNAVNSNIKLGNNTKVIKAVPVTREDVHVDSLILKLISSRDLEKVSITLKKYALVNRYPSRVTFTKLARISSDNSEFHNLDLIKTIVQNAYPKEYTWQMEYQHYYAEALWKSGDYKKALDTFEDLFKSYPQRSKKLSDILNFMIKHIVNKNLEEEFHLVIESMRRVYKLEILQPLSNVWFHAFISSSGTMNYHSWKILEECPDIKPFVITKTDNVLLLAKELKRPDIFQRFIETILVLKVESEYSKVISAFLDFQCKNKDIRGALETFRYAKSQNILLDVESIISFSDLSRAK